MTGLESLASLSKSNCFLNSRFEYCSARNGDPLSTSSIKPKLHQVQHQTDQVTAAETGMTVKAHPRLTPRRPLTGQTSDYGYTAMYKLIS